MKYVEWESVKGKARGIDTEENFNRWSKSDNARGKYRIKRRFESATVPEGYKPPATKEQRREQKAAARDAAIKQIKDRQAQRIEDRNKRMSERDAQRQPRKTDNPKVDSPSVPTPPEALNTPTETPKQPGNQPEKKEADKKGE